MRRRLAAAAGAVLIAILSACAPAVPKVNAPARPAQPPPVVQPSQSERILANLAEQIEASTAAASVEPAPRLGGAARVMREAEFAMRVVDDQAVPDSLGTEFAATVVAASDSWPRSFLALTRPVNAGAQHAYLLTQSDARSEYELVEWVRLVAGAAVPGTETPEIGSRAIAPDDAAGLAASPADALAAYAKAKEGEGVSRFTEEDPARESWHSYIDGWGKVLEVIEGTVGHASAPAPSAPVAFATADGGAIVIGVIDSTLELGFEATGAGQQINLPARIAALGDGTKAVLTSAKIGFTETVALAVPPRERASEPMTVLGVYQVPTSVAIAPQ
jgi:hypothetical protein